MPPITGWMIVDNNYFDNSNKDENNCDNMNENDNNCGEFTKQNCF